MSQRLFVGVALPDPVQDALAELCAGVPGARWLEPEQIHLTLRFIGDVEGPVHREIAARLARVEREGFPLTLRGVGHFPPRGQPRILWVGVEPEPRLLDLRQAVDRAVVRGGAEPERRKFHPHVTIARLNGAPHSRIGRFMGEHSLFRAPAFQVRDFHLYSSKLHPKGAVYSVVESYDLAPELGEDWLEDE